MTIEQEPKREWKLRLIGIQRRGGHEEVGFFNVLYLDGKVDIDTLKKREAFGYTMLSTHANEEDMSKALHERLEALELGPIAVVREGIDEWEVLE